MKIHFFGDKAGSILPAFAIMLVPVLVTAGAAVDYTIAAKNRSKMANIADAAILAASVEAKESGKLDNKQAVEALLKKQMNDFLKANMGEDKNPNYKISAISFDPKTKRVDLKVNYSFDTNFMQLVGIDEIEGNVETAVFLASEERQPLSMVLVLDKSGSMDWSGTWDWNGYEWEYTPGEHRMTALKKAVASMTASFEKEDPKHKYVRTGAVAYSHYVYGSEKLAWGSAHVNWFTQSLDPYGGTDSSWAMANAFHYLKGNKEEKEHAKKNKGNPQKYIVFMTDGENNYSSADRSTLRTCRKAKKKDIIIYTVAFQAPEQGQALLSECATSQQHYFNATNSDELIAAFKKIGDEAAKQLAIAK